VLVLGMVGAALPLTATTVYAEADSSTGDAQKSSLSDFNSVHIENDADSLDITLLDEGRNPENSGDYVYRRDQDGKQVVLRTNRRLSEAEIDQAVAEAEESRIEAESGRMEAEQARREAEQDMREAEIEMRQALREAEQDRREAMAEARIAMREGLQEAEMARREALAEARRAQAEARRIAADIRRETANWSRRVTPPQPPEPPQAASSPEAPDAPDASSARAFSAKPISFSVKVTAVQPCSKLRFQHSTARGVMTERSWAALVECSGLNPRQHERQLLQMTLQSLTQARTALALSCPDAATSEKEMLQAFDREIAHLKAKITRA
jgi:hypothetical protein